MAFRKADIYDSQPHSITCKFQIEFPDITKGYMIESRNCKNTLRTLKHQLFNRNLLIFYQTEASTSSTVAAESSDRSWDETSSMAELSCAILSAKTFLVFWTIIRVQRQNLEENERELSRKIKKGWWYLQSFLLVVDELRQFPHQILSLSSSKCFADLRVTIVNPIIYF